jgi:mannose-6-phosphate isomerase-like protein (cupin superfamily)
VAYRIAGALGMSLGELVEEPAEGSIEVIRAQDRAFQFRDDGECRIRGLVPRHLEKEVEVYQLELAPGHVLESTPHLAGTHEFLTVQSGRLTVESGCSSAQLAAGDSATYPADTTHAIRNLGTEPATAFLVAIYRTRRRA